MPSGTVLWTVWESWFIVESRDNKNFVPNLSFL